MPEDPFSYIHYYQFNNLYHGCSFQMVGMRLTEDREQVTCPLCIPKMPPPPRPKE